MNLQRARSLAFSEPDWTAETEILIASGSKSPSTALSDVCDFVFIDDDL